MSDELLNVEDDTPVPPAPEPPAPPIAAAPPAEAVMPPAEPEDADLNDPELLKDESRLKAILSETSRVRQQNRDLKAKVGRVDELESAVRDSAPYVQFLKANPGLMQRQAPPAAPAESVADPQAEILAKTLDLYTPEGKPDVARAATIRNMMKTEAQQIAQQAIAPVHERSAQEQSARNYQIALTVKDAQGRTPSPEALAQIWRTMPAHQTADPSVASILALTALGLDSVNKRPAPAPPAAPPLVTEGAGGAARRPTLSALEANIARERGIPESKWAEHTKGFVAGRSQQLED